MACSAKGKILTFRHLNNVAVHLYSPIHINFTDVLSNLAVMYQMVRALINFTPITDVYV